MCVTYLVWYRVLLAYIFNYIVNNFVLVSFYKVALSTSIVSYESIKAVQVNFLKKNLSNALPVVRIIKVMWCEQYLS